MNDAFDLKGDCDGKGTCQDGIQQAATAVVVKKEPIAQGAKRSHSPDTLSSQRWQTSDGTCRFDRRADGSVIWPKKAFKRENSETVDSDRQRSALLSMSIEDLPSANTSEVPKQKKPKWVPRSFSAAHGSITRSGDAEEAMEKLLAKFEKKMRAIARDHEAQLQIATREYKASLEAAIQQTKNTILECPICHVNARDTDFILYS